MQNDRGLAHPKVVREFYYGDTEKLEARLLAWEKYGATTETLTDFVITKAYAQASHITSWLDIGCGTGVLLECLTKRAPHIEISGVDISKAMVRATQVRLGLVYANRICEFDARHLVFEQGSFSVATIMHVLHHVPEHDLSLLLAETARVLSFGGLAIITLPRFTPRQGLNALHYTSLTELSFPAFMRTSPETYFTPEKVAVHARPSFAHTTMLVYKNELRFPTTAAALAYYQSGMFYRGSQGPDDPEISKTQWSQLETMMEERIAKVIHDQGVLIVPGDVDVLICEK